MQIPNEFYFQGEEAVVQWITGGVLYVGKIQI